MEGTCIQHLPAHPREGRWQMGRRGCRYTGVPQEPKERLTRWAMGNLDRKTRERKNQEKRQLRKVGGD